ncbi:MAG: SiaC family regulatory phosphoprotein, partial [Chlorobium sp.]|nr:SiaC family regulatory phosphoprotein [Chlorobium sp.]
YMNSSSTKCTLDIMDILEDAHERGVKTSIIWRYDRENSRSYEMAEDFREEVTFSFEIEALDT